MISSGFIIPMTSTEVKSYDFYFVYNNNRLSKEVDGTSIRVYINIVY